MEVLEIILYVFGALLLGVLVVLVIKLMGTIDRINKILDNVEGKVKSLDSVFNAVDKAADSFAIVSDKIVDGVASLLTRFLVNNKKKKKVEKIDEGE